MSRENGTTSKRYAVKGILIFHSPYDSTLEYKIIYQVEFLVTNAYSESKKLEIALKKRQITSSEIIAQSKFEHFSL